MSCNFCYSQERDTCERKVYITVMLEIYVDTKLFLSI